MLKLNSARLLCLYDNFCQYHSNNNNNQPFLKTQFVPGTIPQTYILCYLIHITTLYYPYFIDGKLRQRKVKQLVQGSTSSR